MTRPPRIFFEGAVYHVYNRLARGERVFDDRREAEAFCGILRDVVERDDLTVFAWCLMPNHYHLAIRVGMVSLDRPMRSLQQRITQRVNLRRKVAGPLWQGRYRAKLVQHQRYLDQLLAYIHLNPLASGVVTDPAEYPWSGHREVLGRVTDPIVDVDEVLALFAKSRRAARVAYIKQLKGGVEARWIGEEPGRLPWWRIGRPVAGDHDDPEIAVRAKRRTKPGGPGSRPHVSVSEYLAHGSVALGVTMEELRNRQRSHALVRSRELLALVGVERYRLPVVEIASEMAKAPDTVTKLIARATQRRRENEEFRKAIDNIDVMIAQMINGKVTNNGGMA